MIAIKNWFDALAEAYPIRRAVFIQEQRVPEDMELDEYDPIAQHALAYQDSRCVGTARLLILQDQKARIGRMAVLAAYRRQGIGAQLIHGLVDFGCAQGVIQFELHAQLTAIPFYEEFGFVTRGNVYDEAGIAHRDMILSI